MTTLSTVLKEWSSTVVPLLIILALLAIFIIYFKSEKNGFVKYLRYFLLPFTFISGFLIYFWGYQMGNSVGKCHTIIPNLLESFFSTTRLFILGNDLVEIEHKFKVENHLFHALFALTAALAAFVFISFILQVFLKDLLLRGKIRKHPKSENHFFFGISESSLALATDLLQNNCNRLIVFVNDLCKNDNQHLYSQLTDEIYVLKRKTLFDSIHLEKEEGLLGFLSGEHSHGETDSNNSLFYNIKSLKRKIGLAPSHLYFLTNDEDWNIQHAKKALEELKLSNESELTRIHIGTYSEISDKHFQQWSKLSRDKISVVIHHYATLVSRQLISKYHPIDFIVNDPVTASATSDFNALILGFGQVGTNILRKLIEQGQFVGSTFHATVIDNSMHILEGRFDHLYPSIKSNYDLNFVNAEAGHVDFYKEIKQTVAHANYIVIALGNDNLNIQTALEILELNSIKFNSDFKIFIQMETESHWIETLKEFKGKIFFFGDAKSVFNEEIILQGVTEARGRLVHDVYNERIYPDPNNQSFDEISRHEQLSNISVAEHLYAKVRLLGYNNLSGFSNNDEYMRSLTDIQKLNLSITEHLRWNAFHFIHGWTTLPMDQIPGNTPKEKYGNRKNAKLKIHSCLINWDDLAKLKDVIGEDMQIADTNSVLHLYDFINAPYQDDQTKN